MEQLVTICDFGFVSREQIYAKADELKRSIDEKPAESQLQLKHVTELIAVYEKIVEGNYVDNLAKLQTKQEKELEIAFLKNKY